MSHFTPIPALAGGILLGLGATLLLLANGRIAGISGIFAGLFGPASERAWRGWFVAGLLLGGLALWLIRPASFAPGGVVALPVIATAGLLVGFGTRLGGGCTSGHGVCGMCRLSPRSIVATMTFMVTGGAAVYVARHLLGSGS
jgi:hypothetical protein